MSATRGKYHWQPSASIAAIKARAEMLMRIRTFFAKRNVLEVETPILTSFTVTDPHISSFSLDSEHRYLQTSPEYAMKRLLCMDIGAIYQICKAFRKSESGIKHNPEFTMLEWYRPGFNEHDLMQEVEGFLKEHLSFHECKIYTYKKLFMFYLNLDPHTALLSELLDAIKRHNLPYNEKDVPCISSALDILFSNCIETKLPQNTLVFVHEYPKCQRALAKIANNYSLRFEAYFNGIELANGFNELTAADEQRQRFMQDNNKRLQLGLNPTPLDEYLLQALKHGMPNCSGVAVGLDRLLMCKLNYKNISEVLSFVYADI